MSIDLLAYAIFSGKLILFVLFFAIGLSILKRFK